jgi:hypothetical protein
MPIKNQRPWVRFWRIAASRDWPPMTHGGHPPKAADGMALEFPAYRLHAATD